MMVDCRLGLPAGMDWGSRRRRTCSLAPANGWSFRRSIFTGGLASKRSGRWPDKSLDWSGSIGAFETPAADSGLVIPLVNGPKPRLKDEESSPVLQVLLMPGDDG